MSGWRVEMVDVPEDQRGPAPTNFRCDRCGKWCEGEGRWVSRGIGPGHYVAAHKKCPRWWSR